MADQAFRRTLGAGLLRDVSRSFYLSVRWLPASFQEPVAVAYLLARAADTLADAPGLPAGDRMDRLEELRAAVRAHGDSERHPCDCPVFDATLLASLPHPGERELLRRLEDCLRWLRILDSSTRDEVVAVLETITSGQRWDLDRFGVGGSEGQAEGRRLQYVNERSELVHYTYQVAGSVGEFWTRLARLGGFTKASHRPESEADSQETRGTRYGQALQLVNILRDLGDDLDNGRCYLPLTELEAEGWNVKRPWREQGPALEAVAGRWRAQAREWLGGVEVYRDGLRSPRLRWSTELPARLAIATLDKLDEAGESALESRVKISRSEVRRSVVATLMGRSLSGTGSLAQERRKG